MPLAPPIAYSPSLEHVRDDEAETFAEIEDAMRSIRETTYQDMGHALRSVHAKSHGIVQGTLRVEEGLPRELAQGIFATPGEHPVVLRFSTNPGDLLDDKVSTPRGLALKVLGIDGARLPGSEDATTQDFVLVNGPAFSAPDAKGFLRNLKLLAKTTDKAPGLKQALSTVLQATEKVVEALGGKSSTLIALGGHPETHVLGETFFSQVPVRYGDYVAKVSVAPVAPSLTALTGKEVDLDDRPNGLRAEVVSYFASQPGEWAVRVQLLRDLEKMPVEDASVEWPEDASPWQTVARIAAPVQPAWDHARSVAVDDGMSFSPWHGVEAHRPLGSVMRARKAAYEASARFRFAKTQQPGAEPPDGYRLPD